MKKSFMALVSLVLCSSILVHTASAAAFESSEHVYLDTSQKLYFRKGTTELGSATLTDMEQTTLSYSANAAVSTSSYTPLTASFYMNGNANFLGGRSYQVFAQGQMTGSGGAQNITTGMAVDTKYKVSSYNAVKGRNGTVYQYASQTSTHCNFYVNGVLTSIAKRTNYQGTIQENLNWFLASDGDGGVVLYLKGNNPGYTTNLSLCQIPITTGGSPYVGNVSRFSFNYRAIDSITAFFANVSGGDGFTFTADPSSFSIVNGQWKMNAVISLPYGADYEGYINWKYIFSNPSQTGTATSLYFTFEDIAFGDLGAYDPEQGSLGDINASLQQTANVVMDIASMVGGLATESTLGQCLTAVLAIKSYLEGDIGPLLREIEANQHTLISFLENNLLPTIITQLASVISSIDSGFNSTIAAIQAQTAALIAFLNEVFETAAGTMGETNTNLEGAIGSFEDAEGALTDEFEATWSSFDFNEYQASASLGNALTWVSARFTDLFNALGTEVQLIITVPAVLGIALFVVTGSSRYMGRWPRSSIGGE